MNDQKNINLDTSQRGEFYNYLDSEINNLSGDIKRPGWNMWAILVGLATLGWLLLDALESGEYSFQNVIGLLFVLSLTQYLYFSISGVFDSLSTNNQKQARFINVASQIRNWRFFILLIGQGAFLIFASIIFSDDVGTLITTLSIIFAAVIIIAVLFSFALVFLQLPILSSPLKRNLNVIVSVLFSALLLFIIWRHIELLLNSSSTSFNDIRLTLLVAASFYLIVLLIRVPRGLLILDSLIDIRRQLMLGEISIENAVIQTNIALTGLRAYDVLEEYVVKLLSIYREAAAELTGALSTINNLENIYHESQTSEEDQSSLAMPLIESLHNSVDKVKGIIRTTPELIRPLRTRLILMSSAADISDTVDDLDLKFTEAVDEISQHLKILNTRIATILKTYGTSDEQP